MWKIFFDFHDKSKITVTGKGKEIPPHLITKYFNNYGTLCASAIYQQYPQKDHEPQDFLEMALNMKEE